MAAWSLCRLHGSWCIPTFNLSGYQLDHTTDLIWHKQVPLKASIFAWRLLRDQLPTRLNLRDRGIITNGEAGCLAGCDQLGTSQHLFLSCDFYGSLWHGLVCRDRTLTASQIICISLLIWRAVCTLALIFAARLTTLCLDYMGNDRNNRLFNNVENSIARLLDKVKHYSLWWLKASNVNFVFGCTSWWSSPLFCLANCFCNIDRL